MRNRRMFAVTLGAALLLAACGSSPATAIPSATPPPPTPTPNPHLSDPASVDVVYTALQKAGLQITGNSADAGSGGMVKRLHLVYDAWPLVLTEYTSAKTLLAESGFNPKAKPILGRSALRPRRPEHPDRVRVEHPEWPAGGSGAAVRQRLRAARPGGQSVDRPAPAALGHAGPGAHPDTGAERLGEAGAIQLTGQAQDQARSRSPSRPPNRRRSRSRKRGRRGRRRAARVPVRYGWRETIGSARPGPHGEERP